jgi:hypothetical protein
LLSARSMPGGWCSWMRWAREHLTLSPVWLVQEGGEGLLLLGTSQPRA